MSNNHWDFSPLEGIFDELPAQPMYNESSGVPQLRRPSPFCSSFFYRPRCLHRKCCSHFWWGWKYAWDHQISKDFIKKLGQLESWYLMPDQYLWLKDIPIPCDKPYQKFDSNYLVLPSDSKYKLFLILSREMVHVTISKTDTEQLIYLKIWLQTQLLIFFHPDSLDHY